jgi:hypothetical protein
VTLSGAGSTDPNDDPLTYSWRFQSTPAGSTATLAAATAVSPTFTADMAGLYVLSLVVSDGMRTSAPDTVVVEARNGGSQFTVPTTRQGPLFGADAQTPLAGLLAYSSALNADGTTLLLGGPSDSSTFEGGIGAAWVFTRTAGVWTQQGLKLVGTGAVGQNVSQGHAVALSADGNTALVGGPGDNSWGGASWVFTRTGGVWTQQGSKLIGGGAAAPTNTGQGWSVALSADGNIAAIGALFDNENAGAVWIFTRAGEVWTEQAKLIATGNAGPARLGISVALNNDGTTLVAGGSEDNTNGPFPGFGAVWVFTRNGTVWTQQGPKLVGTGATGPYPPQQGRSIALSADGNTVVIGGPSDNEGMGAAWVFTRTAGVWTQQGPKLAANDAVFDPRISAQQGYSVAISDDGNIALIGGRGDNQGEDRVGAGAVWYFTRTAGVWTQQGPKIVNPLTFSFGSSVALSANASTAAVTDSSQAWVYVP